MRKTLKTLVILSNKKVYLKKMEFLGANLKLPPPKKKFSQPTALILFHKYYWEFIFTKSTLQHSVGTNAFKK